MCFTVKHISNRYMTDIVVKQYIDFCFTTAYNKGRGGVYMAQSMVNFRMDSELKQNMEKVCMDMGLSMTTAFTIFAKTVTREKRIPFEITADPFYSEANMKHLRRSIAALNEGRGVEHKLIEVDTDEENMG